MAVSIVEYWDGDSWEPANTNAGKSATVRIEIDDNLGNPRTAKFIVMNPSRNPFSTTTAADRYGPLTGKFSDFTPVRIIDSTTNVILFAGRVYNSRQEYDKGWGQVIKVIAKDNLAELADIPTDDKTEPITTDDTLDKKSEVIAKIIKDSDASPIDASLMVDNIVTDDTDKFIASATSMPEGTKIRIDSVGKQGLKVIAAISDSDAHESPASDFGYDYYVDTQYTLNYTTGTASQSGTTVTGSGTTWTAAMVGDVFSFTGGGGGGTITARASNTSITVSNSATVSSGTYTIASNPAQDLNYFKRGTRTTFEATASNFKGLTVDYPIDRSRQDLTAAQKGINVPMLPDYDFNQPPSDLYTSAVVLISNQIEDKDGGTETPNMALEFELLEVSSISGAFIHAGDTSSAWDDKRFTRLENASSDPTLFADYLWKSGDQVDVGKNTDAAIANATITTITVETGHGLKAGDIITIESENMYVKQVGVATYDDDADELEGIPTYPDTTLVVIRGWGSTAAAHAGNDIDIYRQRIVGRIQYQSSYSSTGYILISFERDTTTNKKLSTQRKEFDRVAVGDSSITLTNGKQTVAFVPSTGRPKVKYTIKRPLRIKADNLSKQNAVRESVASGLSRTKSTRTDCVINTLPPPFTYLHTGVASVTSSTVVVLDDNAFNYGARVGMTIAKVNSSGTQTAYGYITAISGATVTAVLNTGSWTGYDGDIRVYVPVRAGHYIRANNKLVFFEGYVFVQELVYTEQAGSQLTTYKGTGVNTAGVVTGEAFDPHPLRKNIDENEKKLPKLPDPPMGSLGWSFDGIDSTDTAVFTPIDRQTIKWTGGELSVGSKKKYKIVAGNTGDMTTTVDATTGYPFVHRLVFDPDQEPNANGQFTFRVYSMQKTAVDQLAEALDNSETGVDVDDASDIYAGDFIKVDNEIMKVSSKSSNTLTVVRGQDSTSAAAHDDNSAVQIRPDSVSASVGISSYYPDMDYVVLGTMRAGSSANEKAGFIMDGGTGQGMFSGRSKTGEDSFTSALLKKSLQPWTTDMAVYPGSSSSSASKNRYIHISSGAAGTSTDGSISWADGTTTTVTTVNDAEHGVGSDNLQASNHTIDLWEGTNGSSGLGGSSDNAKIWYIYFYLADSSNVETSDIADVTHAIITKTDIYSDAQSDSRGLLAMVITGADTDNATVEEVTIQAFHGKGLNINADVIAANAITADAIKAGSISTTKLDFVPVSSSNVIASIRASTEGLVIQGDRVEVSGDTTFESGFNPSEKAKLFYQSSAPSSGVTDGDLWIDTDDQTIYSYASSTWVVRNNAKAAALEKRTIFSAALGSVPTSIAAGDLWLTTDTNQLYIALSHPSDAITSNEWTLKDDADAINRATTTINGGLINTQRIKLLKGGGTGATVLDTNLGSTVTSTLRLINSPAYTTGTASQSSQTVTGSSTSWNDAMIGRTFTFGGGGGGGTITAVASTTSLTVSNSGTVSSGSYSISSGVGTTATDITIDAYAGGDLYIYAGDVIRIDSEDMYVTGGSDTSITVIRAWNGTSAATHADDALIYKYNNPVTGITNPHVIMDNYGVVGYSDAWTPEFSLSSETGKGVFGAGQVSAGSSGIEITGQGGASGFIKWLSPDELPAFIYRFQTDVGVYSKGDVIANLGDSCSFINTIRADQAGATEIGANDYGWFNNIYTERVSFESNSGTYEEFAVIEAPTNYSGSDSATARYTIILPTGAGSANEVFKIDSVSGTAMTMDWAADATSSLRYKENITALDIDTAKIFNLVPKSFTWKKDMRGKILDPKGSDRPSFGYIAEEVEKILPEILGYDEENKPKQLDYKLLSVLLLEEVKKLKARVDLLEGG